MAMFDKTDRKISRLLQKAYEELQPHTTATPAKPSSS
jgi:hypothetical protein